MNSYAILLSLSIMILMVNDESMDLLNAKKWFNYFYMLP